MKYLTPVQIFFKSQIIFPSRLIGAVITFSIRTFVVLGLYSYAFGQRDGNIGGITLPVALWSIAMYFIFIYIGARSLGKDFRESIISGNVETMINKPWNYLLYSMFSNLGKSLPELITIIITALPVLFVITDVPSTVPYNLIWWLYAVAIFIFGAILAYIFYTSISLAGFWIEDAQPIFWINDKFVMILGGSYLPVALFPEALQIIAKITPFGSSLFISHIFYEDFMVEAPLMIFTQVLWILVLGFLTHVTFKQALLKLSVNGG